MAILVPPNTLGKMFIDIFNMPKHTIEFSINFKAGQLVTVDCKFHPVNKAGEIADKLEGCEFTLFCEDKNIKVPTRKKRRMDSED